MIEIIQIGDSRLRQVCETIPKHTITEQETKKDIEKLNEALASQSDGVAISAPQIGIIKSIFVVGGMVFDKEFQEGTKKLSDVSTQNKVYINPVITKYSKDTESMEEGCLSIRGVYGNVVRPKKIVIEYYNEQGEKKTDRVGGFLSRVIQHEFDHLHGILFIDKVTDTWQNDEYKEKI